MKAKIFGLLPVFIFLIVGNKSVYGQSAGNTYILSNITKSISLKEKGYYILKINDLRINKTNVGSINLDAGKLPVQTPDSVTAYFYNVFSSSLKVDTSLSPLIINIEKIKTLAFSNNKTDEADLFLKVNFQVPDGNSNATIYSFEKIFNYKKPSSPDFLPELIYTAISKSLVQLPPYNSTSRQLPYRNNDIVSDEFVLSNIIKPISLKEKGYYIIAVNDLRTNKKNLGSINIKSGKLPILTTDSLPIFIYNGIVPHSTSDSSLKPLIINIEKLKSFASTNGTIDDAELFIKINAQIQIGSGVKTIHSFERLFTYKKKSKPDFLTDLLVSALNAALYQLPSGLINPNLKVTQLNETGTRNKIPSKISYIIPLPENNISLEDIKINKIEDQRVNNENVGNVYVGYFNRNGKANLDLGLIKYLSNVLNIDTTKNEKQITLVINKLECNENLTNIGEQAKFLLMAEIVIDSLDFRSVIYQDKVEIDTTIDDEVSILWPAIIVKGFQKYFSNYKIQKNKSVYPESISSILSGEIITEKVIAKRYYANENEIKTIGTFRNIFYKTTDDTLKKMFKSSKAYIRTGRALITTGAALFAYPLIGYLLSEEKKVKTWYNEEGSGIVSPAYLGGKKTIVPLSVGIFAAGFIVKWIGKGLLTQSISRYNKSLVDKISFDITPSINESGYSFKLGILLSQNK